jgi:hypothetical protein
MCNLLSRGTIPCDKAGASERRTGLGEPVYDRPLGTVDCGGKRSLAAVGSDPLSQCRSRWLDGADGRYRGPGARHHQCCALCMPADHEKRLTAATIKMPKAIDDIDALLAVEGIDVVFIGPVTSRRT